MNDINAVTGQDLDHLLVSAMYAEHQSAYLNSYETGLEKNDLHRILEHYWHIFNRQQAQDYLEHLLEKSQDRYLDVVYNALSDTSHYMEILQENLPKDTKIFDAYLNHYEKLKRVLPELIDLGVLDNQRDAQRYKEAGWNYGLCAFIGRCCYDLGYISEEELKKYLEQAYLGLKQFCTTWQEYAASYILGRAIWGGKQNENMIGIASSLLTNSKSPIKHRVLI